MLKALNYFFKTMGVNTIVVSYFVKLSKSTKLIKQKQTQTDNAYIVTKILAMQ